MGNTDMLPGSSPMQDFLPQKPWEDSEQSPNHLSQSSLYSRFCTNLTFHDSWLFLGSIYFKFSCQLKSRKKSRLKDDVDFLLCRSFSDHVVFSTTIQCQAPKNPKIILTHFWSADNRLWGAVCANIRGALFNLYRYNLSEVHITVRPMPLRVDFHGGIFFGFAITL